MTTVGDLEDLLLAVDVDEMEDIETLLMFLFARPIQVGEAWDDDGIATSIDVIVRGNEESIGFTHDFPLSVMELARSCAQTVGELGPYTADDFDAEEEATDVSAMSDAELITALQQALGKTRLFNMIEVDD